MNRDPLDAWLERAAAGARDVLADYAAVTFRGTAYPKDTESEMQKRDGHLTSPPEAANRVPGVAEETPPFAEFAKIARLSRECTITEKIDGTNASILITESGEFFIGSRTRWITPADDNFGFAKWVFDNMKELERLGPGHHFGEWWGAGIQRKYGQERKRFSLFNTFRWMDDAARPACCDVVPVIHQGLFTTEAVAIALESLRALGSVAAPGFMNPEGVIVYHHAAHQYFKKTLHKDDEWKGKAVKSPSQA